MNQRNREEEDEWGSDARKTTEIYSLVVSEKTCRPKKRDARGREGEKVFMGKEETRKNKKWRSAGLDRCIEKTEGGTEANFRV